MGFYCGCCIDQDPALKAAVEQMKIQPIILAGKKRQPAVQRTKEDDDLIREARKLKMQERRKKLYKLCAAKAKENFDTWFKGELEVKLELVEERVLKTVLEREYHRWCSTKEIPKDHRMSTACRRDGMHFTEELLKRIGTKLSIEVKCKGNASQTKCFPYIRHKNIKT
mgnify:CR=1 FL=1